MHNNATLKPDKPSVYKFVKVNGEYRFIESTAFSGNHTDLVDDGETATAAGTIFIAGDENENMLYFKMYEYYSMTLKVSCKGGEEKEIAELLGLEEKSKWE